MATRTIANGGGLWSAIGTWVEGAVPLASDDVVATATSGTLTIDSGAVCRSIDLNLHVGIIIHNAGATLTIGDATAGAGNRALRFSSSMIYILNDYATSAITFVSTSATQQTVNWGGKTTGNVTYNGTGSWLTGQHYWSAFATLNITKGTYNTNNGYHAGGQFNSSNSNTRTITFGSTLMELTGIGNNCFLCATVTGLTVTANTATIKLYRSLQCSAPLFQSGTITWDFNLEFRGGGIATIASGGTPVFKSVKVYGGADLGDGREDRLQLNNSFTCTATSNAIVMNGYSSARRLRLHSNGSTIRTLTVPNTTCVTGQYCDFQNITLTNTNNLSAVTGGSGDIGGNTGIVFTTGATQFWYSATTGVKDWFNSANWFLGSGGTGGAGRVPLPQDNTRFDSASFVTTGVTVQITGYTNVGISRAGQNMDWTGVTNSPTFDIQNDINIYGNVTFSASMTITAYANLFITLAGNGTSNSFTITTNGITIPCLNLFFSTNSTNTYTMQDAINLPVGSTLQLNSGIWDFNNKNYTGGKLVVDCHNATLGNGTITLTGTGTVLNVTSFPTTFSGASSVILITDASATAKNITGSGTSRTMNNLTISGAGDAVYTFSGTMTWNNFTTKSTVHTLAFTTGTTTTFTGTITCVGSAGNLISLRSTTTTAFTWSKASGTVNCDYLIITKSTVSGGATFNAGTNSADGGGNTGWTGLTTALFTWLGGTGVWNLGANWQGGNVPSTTDIALFTAISVANCNMDANVNCLGIKVTLGYTGTITQNTSITVGAGGFEVTNGTFTGSTQAITIAGYFRLVTGTFTSTSGLLQVGAILNNFAFDQTGGTFTHNSGSVKVLGSVSTGIRSTSSLNNVEIDIGASSTLISGSITVAGTLTLTSMDKVSNLMTATLSGATASFVGTNGSCNLSFTGTGTQTFDGTDVGSFTINKASGALVFNTDLNALKSWTHTTGTITWNSHKVTVKPLVTFFTFSNAQFYDLTLNIGSGITVQFGTAYPIVSHNLEFNNQSGANNFPDCFVGGDVIFTTANGKMSHLTFNGSGSQAISGSANCFAQILIAKTGGTLTLNSDLTFNVPYSTANESNIDLQLDQGTLACTTKKIILRNTLRMNGGVFTGGTQKHEFGNLFVFGGSWTEADGGTRITDTNYSIASVATYTKSTTLTSVITFDTYTPHSGLSSYPNSVLDLGTNVVAKVINDLELNRTSSTFAFGNNATLTNFTANGSNNTWGSSTVTISISGNFYNSSLVNGSCYELFLLIGTGAQVFTQNGSTPKCCKLNNGKGSGSINFNAINSSDVAMLDGSIRKVSTFNFDSQLYMGTAPNLSFTGTQPTVEVAFVGSQDAFIYMLTIPIPNMVINLGGSVQTRIDTDLHITGYLRIKANAKIIWESTQGTVYLGGDLMIDAGVSIDANPTIVNSPLWKLNGTGEQLINGDVADNIPIGLLEINKNNGSVIQKSNINKYQNDILGNSDITITKGIWCTNQFNLQLDGTLTINNPQGELQKTPISTISYNSETGTEKPVGKCTSFSCRNAFSCA
jgi:hypothetical protein